MTNSKLMQLSKQIGLVLKAKGETVTIAESCTGGWITKTITDTAGSSAWFQRGFITYSNEAKSQMINVRKETILSHGPVSEPVIVEMAIGALQAAKATYALSVSGIAGPNNGSKVKPVGTVWFGLACVNGQSIARFRRFQGNRDAVRRQATVYALQFLWQQFLQSS